MRVASLLWVALFASSAIAQSTGVVGCVYQDPAGKLWLQAMPSRTRVQLTGNTNLLLHHVNEIIALPDPTSNSVSPTQLSVDRLRVIAETCTSVLPADRPQYVGGKTGIVTSEANVSSTASASETTPGFQTESGLAQRIGGMNPKPEESSASAYAPIRSDQAGESEAAADTNAAAALRAEMYPGSTLGVNDKGPPPSSVRSLQATSQSEAPQ